MTLPTVASTHTNIYLIHHCPTNVVVTFPAENLHRPFPQKPLHTHPTFADRSARQEKEKKKKKKKPCASSPSSISAAGTPSPRPTSASSNGATAAAARTLASRCIRTKTRGLCAWTASTRGCRTVNGPTVAAAPAVVDLVSR